MGVGGIQAGHGVHVPLTVHHSKICLKACALLASLA